HEEEQRFREMDFGVFEMRSYEEMKEDPDYLKWITGDNESNEVPGGESGRQMTARVIEGLQDVIDTGVDTLIVTHGGVVAAIMSHMFPVENKNRYEWQPSAGRGYIINVSDKSYKRL
ncbi:MAG: histidine phosphatase family protein, partial [Oscillospiraceae bacterium]|nr:histidine phosphatase family protein [Oscillospiraceae bacterium]